MSSQKFIGRNRAPRVQIEYDVEAYGADKSVQLPFVMGVMSDLSGNAGKPKAPVAERKFMEIAADSLDERMKAMEPKVSMQVPNRLTGEGNMKLTLEFEKLDDFRPGAIAQQVPALRKLLEARTQLANLITYMDGKTGAEDLIAQALNDPEILKSLAATAKPAEEEAADSKPEEE